MLFRPWAPSKERVSWPWYFLLALVSSILSVFSRRWVDLRYHHPPEYRYPFALYIISIVQFIVMGLVGYGTVLVAGRFDINLNWKFGISTLAAYVLGLLLYPNSLPSWTPAYYVRLYFIHPIIVSIMVGIWLV